MKYIHTCKKSEDQGARIVLCNSAHSVETGNSYISCIEWCPYCGDDLNEEYARRKEERRGGY